MAQDQLALTQATAAKAQGTLVAPISGTVAAVGLTKGGSASSADTVTIVGAGAAAVTVDATLAQLPQLADGQSAKVSVPGANGSVDGYVTNVGILAGSTGTYPVTILVDSAPGAFASGAQAQAFVTTKSVTDVVTVPVSALQVVATDRAAVTVISGGKATSQVVTVGAVGGGVAQVSGLKAGATVALANLKEALPGSGSTSNGSALTGGTAFTGGGLSGGTRRFGG